MRHIFLHLTFVCIALPILLQGANPNYTNNRPPLLEKPFMELPLGNIKPQGWLKEQLQRMADGMTGHLDEWYPEVMGPRNGWLGGDGDQWERGPYWIDGLLPLAYILEDDSLQAKVQPWIEWALASQQEDGFFGPAVDYAPEPGLQRNNSRDWWPKMVMLKIMQQYYSATGDRRVIDFLTRYFKYQLKTLPETPLGHWTFWGERRGGDNLMVVLWLYNITGDAFLLELADLIHKQTYDWTGTFLSGDQLTTPFSLHCVNLGQGFKEPVVYYQKSRNPDALKAIERARREIRRGIGIPNGLWGGDEMLRWGNPTQGSELCTAVEMMFSLEQIIQITGLTSWADYLERVAYNALPTQINDDFSARQYYQQTNQIALTRRDRDFVTCYNGTDQLMGLLTGYPCCTSNLHQGWPKFVQNLWYATHNGGVAAMVYGPSSVKAKVADGTEITIEEDTFYPFNDTIRFRIGFDKAQTVRFPIELRIPGWCENPVLSINGERLTIPVEEGIATIDRNWQDGDRLQLILPMRIDISYWYNNSAVVERGPLVYALKMNETWQKMDDDRKFGTRYGKDYYEVRSDSKWNYALIEANLRKEALDSTFTVVHKHPRYKSYPWNVDQAPIEIITTAKELPIWEKYGDDTGPIPYSPQYQIKTPPAEPITLIPYGCTTLRITEFPVTRK